MDYVLQFFLHYTLISIMSPLCIEHLDIVIQNFKTKFSSETLSLLSLSPLIMSLFLFPNFLQCKCNKQVIWMKQCPDGEQILDDLNFMASEARFSKFQHCGVIRNGKNA